MSHHTVFQQILFLILYVGSTTLLNSQVKAQDSANSIKIYTFELHQEIAPGAVRLLNDAIEAAEAQNADVLVLDLDTYGGLVDAADEIRTTLLNVDLKTVVFIRNNAASAGALISLACDSIYMTSSSTIGAATVVDQSGQKVPDKYQSYMRTKMRATAEAKGRNPDIAEGMVDEDVEIDGITKKGKIITFSVTDAIKHGYCEAKVESLQDVYERIGGTDYTVEEHTLSDLDKIVQKLMSPYLSGILLLIIIGGIYFELQTPGVGFPLAASLIAAVLYFAPLYLEGLAANWEILLFIVGLLLLAAEIFIIPGFGVAGIAGIAVLVVSLTLSLVRNIDFFDFTFVPNEELIRAFSIVSFSFGASFILILAFGKTLVNSSFFSKVSLSRELNEEESAISSKKDIVLVGKTGEAVTDLRPAGKIEIDGLRFDAQADGEFISKGSHIKVLRSSGAVLIVTEVRS